MVAEQIAQLLQEKNFGRIGESIFVGAINSHAVVAGKKDHVKAVIGIFDTGGREPELYFDGTATLRPTFQVLVKNESYAAGRDCIQSIFDLLNGMTDPLVAFAQQSPAPLGRDDDLLTWVFSCNFEALL